MNKSILTAALLAATLSFVDTNAQIASREGVTLEEIVKEVNQLAQKGDEASIAQVTKEAEIMANSDNEIFATMAISLYGFLNKTEEAEKLTKSLPERFPKGLQARRIAFEAIIKDESLSAAQLANKYEDWLTTFPKSYFEKLNAGQRDFGFGLLTYYGQAADQVAKRLIQAGEYDKALSYANAEPTANKSALVQDLIAANQFEKALPLAQAAYEKNKTDLETAQKENKAVDRAEWFYNVAAAQYAEALMGAGNTDNALEISRQLFDSGYDLPSNTALLAQGLQKQGKDAEAFQVLHDAMVKSGRSADKSVLYTAIEPLHKKLNKGDFNAYTASLDKQIKEATLAKYKSEMIKKEAPEFALVNRAGETVKLSDLKGKVVILDFWATWCGPCVRSFPGMQAAVNKYKDDKEVEFLFIDTWQREENYKEVVEEFITTNNYNFHVLFDEMKDREKATTTSYGVQGIPHKVVIDKEGFIRFESSGSGSDVNAIVAEMDSKIELAKQG